MPTSGATTKLRFRYAVAADDLDEDGISLDADSFALADGSAMANLLGQPVDASSPTHEGISPNAAHCVAPAHGVNIIVITSRPEGGWYGVGDRINIIVSVPRGVVLPVPQDVGQVPTMTIEVGNPGATASRVLLMDEPVSEEYFLVFRYVVAENDYDSDGLFFPGSCISAVPGALMDPYGRDIGLGNSATGPLLHHAVDGVRPTVSSPPIIAVAPPAVWGEPYAVSVTFSLSEAVTAVEGSPTLVISLKDASDAVATVTATLDVTATTSEALVLAAALEHPAPGAYTLEVVENSLAIAGASIVDVAGNAMTDASHAGTDITLSVPQPELRVSGVSLASSPRPEAAGWYAIRDSILIEVSCSVVVELDLSAGSPTVSLSVGGRAEPAALESGAGTAVLTFRYDVREGDLEEGGVAVVADSLGLNGAVVTNATVKSLAHAAVASEHRVDGVAPTVLSGPIITEIAAATNFGIGAAVEITVDFSEAVSVAGSLSLSLSLGAAPRLAVLQRLTEGGRVAVFQYTVTESDPSGATVAVAEGSMALEEGGAVRDRAGNALVFPIGHPGASGGRVDTVRPTILAVVGITGPSGSAFAAGELISVRISASESLRVTETPSLTLTLGSAERTAPLTHASGSSLVFTYQVADGDSAPDGVSLSPDSARISGGTVTDLAGNPLNLALPPSGPPDLPPIDTSGPSIAGVTLQQRQDGGPFRMGDSIVATVAFSTAVELPPTAVLWLGIGDGAVPATLVGGNGTAEAKFRYAVAVGEYDIDGIDVRGLSGNEADGAPTSAAAVLLPSGAALATKNASKSFEMTFVDAVPPSVTVAAFTGVLGGSTANLTRVPELVSVQLTLSERVSVSGGGVPSVSVRIGGATYMAYADPSALLAGALSSLTFSYRVVSEPDFAAAEVSLLPDSLRLGGLTVSDWAGNALALSNPSLTVRIGAAAPAVPPAETPASAAAPEPPSGERGVVARRPCLDQPAEGKDWHCQSHSCRSLLPSLVSPREADLHSELSIHDTFEHACLGAIASCHFLPIPAPRCCDMRQTGLFCAPPAEDDAPGPASEDGTDGADETDGADGVDDNASEGPADGSTPDVDPGSGEEEDPGVQDGEDDGGGSNDGSVGEGGGVDGEGSGDGAVNDPGEVGDGVVADGGSGEGKENDVDDGASGESGGNAEGDVVAGGNAAAQPFLLRIAYNMSIDVGASGQVRTEIVTAVSHCQRTPRLPHTIVKLGRLTSSRPRVGHIMLDTETSRWSRGVASVTRPTQVPWGELEARARSATAWQFGVPEERVIVRLDSAQRRALLQAQTVSYEAIVAFPSKEEADGVATIFQR